MHTRARTHHATTDLPAEEKSYNLFSEQAFYYSYYVDLVDADSFVGQLEWMTHDDRAEAGNVINALNRLNIYPEVCGCVWNAAGPQGLCVRYHTRCRTQSGDRTYIRKCVWVPEMCIGTCLGLDIASNWSLQRKDEVSVQGLRARCRAQQL